MWYLPAMKRTIFLTGLALCGCSTAPVADVLDRTFPGKSVPTLNNPDGDTRLPPPVPRQPSTPPAPAHESSGPGSDAPPLPPPPVDP